MFHSGSGRHEDEVRSWRHRNWVRLNFTEPALRTLNADWEQTAQLCVARLHMEVARDPHDPRLAELVGELSVLDADCRRWWSEHHVAARTRGTKRYQHPIVGNLSLDWETLAATSHTDQQLIYWSAAPDTDSRDRLDNSPKPRTLHDRHRPRRA